VGGALAKGAVVVYESTIDPGATENICGPELERESGLRSGEDFTLGYSPERINPGDRQHTLERITKVVAAQDAATLDRVASAYGRVIDAGVYATTYVAQQRYRPLIVPKPYLLRVRGAVDRPPEPSLSKEPRATTQVIGHVVDQAATVGVVPMAHRAVPTPAHWRRFGLPTAHAVPQCRPDVNGTPGTTLSAPASVTPGSHQSCLCRRPM